MSHLEKNILSGKKMSKKELKKEAKEELSENRNARDNEKRIKPKKKTEPIKDEKDNYEKKPSEKLKKKRSTANGYMPR